MPNGAISPAILDLTIGVRRKFYKLCKLCKIVKKWSKMAPPQKCAKTALLEKTFFSEKVKKTRQNSPPSNKN